MPGRPGMQPLRPLPISLTVGNFMHAHCTLYTLSAKVENNEGYSSYMIQTQTWLHMIVNGYDHILSAFASFQKRGRLGLIWYKVKVIGLCKGGWEG